MTGYMFAGFNINANKFFGPEVCELSGDMSFEDTCIKVV